MSLKSVTTAFPETQTFGTVPVSILDELTAPNQPKKTPGATSIIASVLGGPVTSQNWKFISASFQAYACMGYSLPAGGGIYGQLGNVIAGVIPNYTGSGVLSTGWPNGILQQLPNDFTLTGKLFDPSQDEMPTSFNTGDFPSDISQLLPISTTIYPPEPLDIIAGEPLAAGIWMYPSLLGTTPIGDPTVALFNICQASCTINYDDGL